MWSPGRLGATTALQGAGVQAAVGVGELVEVAGLVGPREVWDTLALTVGFSLSDSA